ncbi:TPR-like protein [Artomyces pyxidatus]|uniref:TPR-like protein n=1 Tax=Artomyces pyxidatus TaxID=48021 RepID=A0ACB8T5N2_9AGAM|nr:TPR-like protein [Artomyces pyxidatus]
MLSSDEEDFSEDEFGASDEGSEDSESTDTSSSQDHTGQTQASASRREEGERSLDGVEVQIEGDFNRLVQNIRIADDNSTTAVLGKDWDLNIEDQEAEFRNDLRAASGVGRKGGKRGRRPGVSLSPQVRALLGEGNQAYIDSNLQESIRIMQEVIRIEPRAQSAWTGLANCYEDLGQPQKALQLRIMGAHLHHDAEEWDRLARESRDLGFSQQALYCYGKVYSLDRSNINALWDRAALAKEIGDNRTARNSLIAILKRVPHDLTILEELRPILIELSDLALCASLYDTAFEYYSTTFPTGHGVHPETGADILGGGFALMELLVLADLYNTLNEHDKAVHVIRSGCRWLQGRAEQKFWDACEDDREYDETDFRVHASGRDRELPSGKYPLDVNARHRLAVARIKMRESEEGMMHANIVLSQDVSDYAPLFVEIADAYYELEMYAEARPIYELLGQDAGTSSLYILLQVARCCHMLGYLQDAAEVYESVLANDPSLNDAKMRLAGIYEVLNEPRKALDLVYQVIDSRKRRPRGVKGTSQSVDPSSTSLFEETTKKKGKAKALHRLTPAQLHELEKKKEDEVKRGYARVKELWPKMMLPVGSEGQQEAEREWIIEAEMLVETFRETRNLFLTSRNNPFRGMFPRRTRRKAAEDDEDDMASRLHLDIERDRFSHRVKKESTVEGVDNFRGVHFDDWLRLFMQYAFLLTKRGQYDLADEILNHILHSNAYEKQRDKLDTIRLALITCAIYVKRYSTVVEQCRKLVNIYQFNNEPLRLLTASLASGYRSTDSFITSTLQKHLFREIRLSDSAVKGRDTLKWNAGTRRWGLTASKSGEGDEVPEDEQVGPADEKVPAAELPTKDNPILATIYGQISLAAKSYQSAIFYLLHAYDYCPEDPMICLCLAIASMGRAMQRQADNRHHLITQAMAFLSRYRELRQADAHGMDEVEFNFGRAFQQLGLHSLAVRHYERVLEMAENRMEVNPNDVGIAREAAYNLSLIFVTTGATPLAEALYRRWLSL